MKAKVFTSIIIGIGALSLYLWMVFNIPSVTVPVANLPLQETMSIIFFIIFGAVGLSFTVYNLIKWFW